MSQGIPLGAKSFKALVILNIVIAFLLLIIVSAGGFYFWVTARSVVLLNKQPSWDAIDQKWERRVGTEYDQRTHDQYMEFLRVNEESYTNFVEASEAFSRVIMQTGGLCLLGSGASLFMLLRHRRSKAHQSSLS